MAETWQFVTAPGGALPQAAQVNATAAAILLAIE
jgi:hypothetical protein